MPGAFLVAVAAQQPFNSAFYTASVTVIPIFFITLAVELRAARSPVMGRMVALYRYRKLRRFESVRERMHWIFRGILLLLTALLPVATVLGWAAEVAALIALDRRTVSQAAQDLVLLGHRTSNCDPVLGNCGGRSRADPLRRRLGSTRGTARSNNWRVGRRSPLDGSRRLFGSHR
jgi:hypothetical protein